MSLGLVLFISLALLLVGVVPAWPYSRGWGYSPSGVVVSLMFVLVLLMLMGLW